MTEVFYQPKEGGLQTLTLSREKQVQWQHDVPNIVAQQLKNATPQQQAAVFSFIQNVWGSKNRNALQMSFKKADKITKQYAKAANKPVPQRVKAVSDMKLIVKTTDLLDKQFLDSPKGERQLAKIVEAQKIASSGLLPLTKFLSDDQAKKKFRKFYELASKIDHKQMPMLIQGNMQSIQQQKKPLLPRQIFKKISDIATRLQAIYDTVGTQILALHAARKNPSQMMNLIFAQQSLIYSKYEMMKNIGSQISKIYYIVKNQKCSINEFVSFIIRLMSTVQMSILIQLNIGSIRTLLRNQKLIDKQAKMTFTQKRAFEIFWDLFLNFQLHSPEIWKKDNLKQIKLLAIKMLQKPKQEVIQKKILQGEKIMNNDKLPDQVKKTILMTDLVNDSENKKDFFSGAVETAAAGLQNVKQYFNKLSEQGEKNVGKFNQNAVELQKIQFSQDEIDQMRSIMSIQESVRSKTVVIGKDEMVDDEEDQMKTVRGFVQAQDQMLQLVQYSSQMKMAQVTKPEVVEVAKATVMEAVKDLSLQDRYLVDAVKSGQIQAQQGKIIYEKITNQQQSSNQLTSGQKTMVKVYYQKQQGMSQQTNIAIDIAQKASQTLNSQDFQQSANLVAKDIRESNDAKQVFEQLQLISNGQYSKESKMKIAANKIEKQVRQQKIQYQSQSEHATTFTEKIIAQQSAKACQKIISQRKADLVIDSARVSISEQYLQYMIKRQLANQFQTQKVSIQTVQKSMGKFQQKLSEGQSIKFISETSIPAYAAATQCSINQLINLQSGTSQYMINLFTSRQNQLYESMRYISYQGDMQRQNLMQAICYVTTICQQAYNRQQYRDTVISMMFQQFNTKLTGVDNGIKAMSQMIQIVINQNNQLRNMSEQSTVKIISYIDHQFQFFLKQNNQQFSQMKKILILQNQNFNTQLAQLKNMQYEISHSVFNVGTILQNAVTQGNVVQYNMAANIQNKVEQLHNLMEYQMRQTQKQADQKMKIQRLADQRMQVIDNLQKTEVYYKSRYIQIARQLNINTSFGYEFNDQSLPFQQIINLVSEKIKQLVQQSDKNKTMKNKLLSLFNLDSNTTYDSLVSVLQKMKKDIQTINIELKKAKDQLARINNDIGKIGTQKEKIQRQNNSKLSQLQQIQNDSNQFKKKIKRYQEQIRLLDDAITNLNWESLVNYVQTSLKDNNTLISITQKFTRIIKKQLQKNETKYKQTKQRFEQQISETKKNYDKKMNSVEQQRIVIQKLKSNVVQKERRILQLEKEITMQKKRAGDMQNMSGSQRKKLESLVTEKNNIQIQKQKIKGDSRYYQMRYNQQFNKVRMLKQDLKQLQENLEKLKRQHDSKIQQQKIKYRKLQVIFQEGQKKHQDLKVEHEKEGIILKQRQENINNLKSQLNEAKLKIQNQISKSKNIQEIEAKLAKQTQKQMQTLKKLNQLELDLGKQKRIVEQVTKQFKQQQRLVKKIKQQEQAAKRSYEDIIRNKDIDSQNKIRKYTSEISELQKKAVENDREIQKNTILISAKDNQIKMKLLEYNTLTTQLKNSIQQRQRTINSLSINNESQKNRAGKLQKQVKDLKIILNQATQNYEKLNTQFKATKNQLGVLKGTNQTLQGQITRINDFNKTQTETMKRSHQSQIEKLTQNIKLKDKQKTTNQQLLEKQKQISMKNSLDLKTIQKKYENLQVQKVRYEKEVIKFEKQREEIAGQLEKQKKQLKIVMENFKNASENYNQAQTTKKKLLNQFQLLKQQKRKINENLQTQRKELTNVNQILIKVRAQFNQNQVKKKLIQTQNDQLNNKLKDLNHKISQAISQKKILADSLNLETVKYSVLQNKFKILTKQFDETMMKLTHKNDAIKTYLAHLSQFNFQELQKLVFRSTLTISSEVVNLQQQKIFESKFKIIIDILKHIKVNNFDFRRVIKQILQFLKIQIPPGYQIMTDNDIRTNFQTLVAGKMEQLKLNSTKFDKQLKDQKIMFNKYKQENILVMTLAQENIQNLTKNLQQCTEKQSKIKGELQSINIALGEKTKQLLQAQTKYQLLEIESNKISKELQEANKKINNFVYFQDKIAVSLSLNKQASVLQYLQKLYFAMFQQKLQKYLHQTDDDYEKRLVQNIRIKMQRIQQAVKAKKVLSLEGNLYKINGDGSESEEQNQKKENINEQAKRKRKLKKYVQQQENEMEEQSQFNTRMNLNKLQSKQTLFLSSAKLTKADQIISYKAQVEAYKNLIKIYEKIFLNIVHNFVRLCNQLLEKVRYFQRRYYQSNQPKFKSFIFMLIQTVLSLQNVLVEIIGFKQLQTLHQGYVGLTNVIEQTSTNIIQKHGESQIMMNILRHIQQIRQLGQLNVNLTESWSKKKKGPVKQKKFSKIKLNKFRVID